MTFSRRFPLDKPGSPYPSWEEMFLTAEDEEKVEKTQREANNTLMRECLEDAQKIVFEQEFKDFQSDVVSIARALFDKRASHLVYWKEEEAKKRFDKTFHQKEFKK